MEFILLKGLFDANYTYINYITSKTKKLFNHAEHLFRSNILMLPLFHNFQNSKPNKSASLFG